MTTLRNILAITVVLAGAFAVGFTHQLCLGVLMFWLGMIFGGCFLISMAEGCDV